LAAVGLRSKVDGSRGDSFVVMSSTEGEAGLLEGLAPGRQLGDFVIERLIGRGGMGRVYQARQLSLGRLVALKVLKPELAGDPQYLKRFEVEARSLAPINHPNIISVYAIGEHEGLHFIALEYVRGINLRQAIDKYGPLSERACYHIASRVASALERASESGIIHRDIKPENVLLARRSDVKVADFGLARHIGGEDVRLTQTGVTMGTPLYMSPEQIQGQPVDVRSDLYSLGIMCYHMLAGEPPYRGETAMALAIQHVNGKPESLADIRPDVRREFLAAVARLMARQVEERYSSPAAFLEDLNRMGRPAGSSSLELEDETLDGYVVALPTFGQQVRMGWSALFRPPLRRWTALASVALTLVAGLAAGAVVDRVRSRRGDLPDVRAIPVQSNGFLQYWYAGTIDDPIERQKALWAVLLRHRGDDRSTIQAARDLADAYYTSADIAGLDRLGRYLLDREDLTQKTYGHLVTGLARTRESRPKEAEVSFAKMIALADQEEWSGESLDWLSRRYLSAQRINDLALRRPTEERRARIDEYWEKILSPPGASATKE
jgi:hypothetical protein